MQDIIRNVIRAFCLEFVREPYTCYTEHGVHALFFSRLMEAIPEGQRYADWQGHRVCIVQKEYPTAGKLGKPQRQHWDVSVLKTPLCSITCAHAYDYLRLAAAIEFGLNAPADHLLDDLQRLSHPDANLEAGFAVHLYRLSQAGALLSGHDFSHLSGQIVRREAVAEIIAGTGVEVYYGMADLTRTHESGAWRIAPDGSIQPVTGAP